MIKITVKQLKGELDKFPEGLVVMVPNSDLHRNPRPIWFLPATNVARGVNEEDGFVFIDNYEEEH